MVYVIKKKGDNKDSLFRKFTRMFLDEEIIEEVRSRLHYKKPSQVEKEKEKERRRGGSRRRS